MIRSLLIVEDVAETRRWLADIARAAFPDCEIAFARNMASGLAAAETGECDLALIDLGLPDGSGIEILRKLRQTRPEALCVVTTVIAEDAQIVAALSAGASGYLLKEQPPELITRQLAQLAEGIPALSPAIARRIMEHFRNTGPAADTDGSLTTREKDVLALISRGMRNADVAQQLGLAEGTVATHLKSVYRKLGISSRAEASWHAARLGLAPGAGDRE